MGYSNPIISGFNPDPSICRVGEDYYVATSTLDFFPGIPLYHSKDLINWRHIGYCLSRMNQFSKVPTETIGHIYAPTLRYYNGRFYMITTNASVGQHFYVYTDDILGEWSDPVFVDGTGHDPDLFFDAAGKVYMSRFNGNQGILLQEIVIATGELIGEAHSIWPGYEDRQCEAPHIYAINGWYYLITAEGGTWRGHMVTISRSKQIEGPYEGCPANPILTHRCLIGYKLQTIGHGDLIQAHDGAWWMICLGTRTTGYLYHHLGRETFLAPVTWDEEGWPIVNYGLPLAEFMDMGTLPVHQWEQAPVRDDFNGLKLGLQWNYRGNPKPAAISITEREGWLTIHGQAPGLEGIAQAAFIGRRQQHFTCKASALLEFAAAGDGEEAGIVAYASESHYYALAVERINGARYVALKKRIGDIWFAAASEEIAEGLIELEIAADEHTYTFTYTVSGEPSRALGTAETRLLSAEVSGSFLGLYLGLYATGNGKAAQSAAYFDWFDYKAGNEGGC